MTFKKVHKLEKKNVWLTMEEISSWCLRPQWLLLHPSHSVHRTQHLLSGSLQLGYTGTKKSWTNQISQTRSWLCIFQKRTINLGYLMMGFIIVLSNFSNTKKPRVTKISILFQYPGILWLSPFVVVPETTCPFVSTATIPIVSWFK